MTKRDKGNLCGNCDDWKRGQHSRVVFKNKQVRCSECGEVLLKVGGRKKGQKVCKCGRVTQHRIDCPLFSEA